MIRVTVGDSDFLFLMSRIADYVCLVFSEYKYGEHNPYRCNDDVELVKHIYNEFLNSTHIDDNIKNYITNNLNISNVSTRDTDEYDDNGDTFYFNYSYSEKKLMYFVK